MSYISKNPIYYPWNPKDQDSFILICFEKYQNFHKNRISSGLKFTVHHYSKTEETQFLTRLYREGCIQDKLRVEFHQFKKAILEQSGRLRWGPTHWQSSKDHWYERHCVSYREPMKYQKNVNHKKKHLSDADTSNRDWREKKGFRQDQGKGKHWFSGGSKKKFAKEISNRWNRRKEKQAIHNEEYDIFPTINEIHDKWMWD